MPFAVAFQIKSLNPVSASIDSQQATTGPPLEQWLGLDPALQQMLRLLRPEPETADPVLIEPFGHGRRQGSDELTPEARLPAAQLVTIGSTHPSSTQHSPKPRSRGEQQRLGARARSLNGGCHATGATSPDDHVPRHTGNRPEK